MLRKYVRSFYLGYLLILIWTTIMAVIPMPIRESDWLGNRGGEGQDLTAFVQAVGNH